MRNIAATATAMQSSLSKWSHNENESNNFLTGNIQNGYAFHTALEDEPWIRINLKKTYALCGIRIFPRQQCPDKYCPVLEILISVDGVNYTCVYSKEKVFSNPYDGVFIDIPYLHARFIVCKSRDCMLSLSQIEIFINDEVLPFRNVTLWKCQYHNQKILQLLESGYYERQEIDIVLATMHKEDCVLELGANIGVMAANVLKSIAPRAYYAVEANPCLIKEIEKNLALNGCSNYKIINKIFTHENVDAFDFYVNKANILASSLFPNSGASDSVKVQAQNINEFIIDNGITYIICDIEGGEYLLFDKRVHLSTVQNVCMEIHPSSQADSVRNLFAAFEAAGFRHDNPLANGPLQQSIVVHFSKGNLFVDRKRR